MNKERNKSGQKDMGQKLVSVPDVLSSSGGVYCDLFILFINVFDVSVSIERLFLFFSIHFVMAIRKSWLSEEDWPAEINF